ncbi:hypothetical protein M5E88_11630 [Akkermansia muciniphila]|nr:hypothetical protein M5E88_11630 [Akkermansia muciniphila]
MARETREILASLGLRSLDEAVGRADLLSVNRAIDFYKARHLDFSSILHAAEGDGRRFDPSFKKEPLDNYDRRHLLPALKPLLEKGKRWNSAATSAMWTGRWGRSFPANW